MKQKKTINNRIFVDEKLAVKVIMNCRTQHINLAKKKKQDFKQHNVTLIKEQSVFMKIMS